MYTDNDEFSDIFISKQKVATFNNKNNMDYSIKLDISKVIEEEESKLKESINETLVFNKQLKIEDLDETLRVFKSN